MKATYKNLSIRLTIFFSLIVAALNSGAQVTPEDPTNLVQDFVVNIDKLGDASMELTQKMTASQWQYFKQSAIFNDPSITKRDLERSMATYAIEDFKRELDEMNRSVKLSMKVKSYAQYKGNGHWSLKIDSKDPQVTKLTDNAYMITGNAIIGNGLVQQIFKIYFPRNASDVTQTTDEFGKAIFKYDAGAGLASYFTWNNIVGILLILAAIFFLLKPLNRKDYNMQRV